MELQPGIFIIAVDRRREHDLTVANALHGRNMHAASSKNAAGNREFVTMVPYREQDSVDQSRHLSAKTDESAQPRYTTHPLDPENNGTVNVIGSQDPFKRDARLEKCGDFRQTVLSVDSSRNRKTSLQKIIGSTYIGASQIPYRILAFCTCFATPRQKYRESAIFTLFLGFQVLQT